MHYGDEGIAAGMGNAVCLQSGSRVNKNVLGYEA